jgi:hypothetical protein
LIEEWEEVAEAAGKAELVSRNAHLLDGGDVDDGRTHLRDERRHVRGSCKNRRRGERRGRLPCGLGRRCSLRGVLASSTEEREGEESGEEVSSDHGLP